VHPATSPRDMPITPSEVHPPRHDGDQRLDGETSGCVRSAPSEG
jgi:hypothetical protein